MPRRVLTILLAVLAGGLLSSCHLDVEVLVRVDAEGAGDVAVTATADAEVVAQAPGLAEDLRFDDALAAGWTVDGPTPTDDGGLTVRLTHAATSVEDATNLLNSLGPPFTDVELHRTTAPDDPREVTTMLAGTLQLTGGFEAFADPELLTIAGGVPFADDLATSGATPAESMTVRLRAQLPGDVEDTTGTAEGGALVWDAPLDGSGLELTTTAVQRPATGRSWAGPVSWIALVLLIAWLAVAAVVIASVVRARQRRATHRDAARHRRWS